MISLKEWYIRNAKIPSFTAVITIIIIQCLFLFNSYQEKLDKLDKAKMTLKKTMNIAISQKNRTLIESLIEFSASEFSAESVSLCSNNNVVLSYPKNSIRCQYNSDSFFSKTTILTFGGFENYVLVIRGPLLNISPSIILFNLLVIFLAIITTYIIITFQNKFKDTILNPLLNDFELNKPFEIKEFQDFKEKRLKLEEFRKNESLTKIYKQVAHDIRSPIAALSILSESFSNISTENKKLLDTTIERITSMANELLSKGQSHKYEILEQNIDYIIGPLINEKKLQYSKFKNISINFKISNNKLISKFNAQDLKRALSNLINNSIEAISDKGEVEIGTYIKNNFNVLYVKDNGKGIPESVLTKIGKEGLSYNKESNKDSGSGLGVFGAKTIVEKWGGKLEIQSKIGLGTTVSLFIPRF